MAKTKRTTPQNKTDLLDLIQLRKGVPSQKLLFTTPSKSVKNPVGYLARAFDPSSAGIKINNVKTKNEKVFVRLNKEEDITLLKEASALKDCGFKCVCVQVPEDHHLRDQH